MEKAGTRRSGRSGRCWLRGRSSSRAPEELERRTKAPVCQLREPGKNHMGKRKKERERTQEEITARNNCFVAVYEGLKGLIRFVVAHFHSKSPAISEEDARQEALLKLVEIAELYKPESAAKVSTFVCHVLMHEMQDLSSESGMIRVPHSTYEKKNAARREKYRVDELAAVESLDEALEEGPDGRPASPKAQMRASTPAVPLERITVQRDVLDYLFNGIPSEKREHARHLLGSVPRNLQPHERAERRRLIRQLRQRAERQKAEELLNNL